MNRTGAAVFAFLCGTALAASVTTAEAGKFALLHSFAGGSDGANPQAGLTAIGNTLYGTTLAGGSNGGGTVFSLDLKTGAETVMHAFGGGSDGLGPGAGLLKLGDTLYGTTESGGTAGLGSVFSLNLKTGVETVVYSFQGGGDGASPQSRLIEIGGTIYGMTMLGGSGNCYLFGCGTIFTIDPASGAEKIVYVFQSGNDGANPAAGLTKMGRKLYGTTLSGGDGDCGTVFAFDPATGVEAVLHNFDHQGDGNNPGSALTRAGGTLYGTTVAGGSGDPGVGVAFAFDPKTGAERIVHDFNNGGGAIPEDAPLAVGSELYVTTSLGGGSNDGTVFAFDPATGAGRTVHTFTGSDGANPWADLVAAGNRLYGTTYYGGASGNGAVFAIKP